MKTLSSITRAWASALAISACMVASAQASAVLINQPADQAGAPYTSSLSAQNAESFVFGSATTVTGFRWMGVFAGDPSTLTVNTLTVRLFDSALEGTNSDAYITLDGLITRSANPVFTVVSGGFSLPIFEFEMKLAADLAALANQDYSISILASTGNWGWQAGTGGDGNSFFRDDDGTVWNKGTPDLSLTVLGPDAPVGVPEPGSLALVGLALAAAAASRRRAA